MAQNRFFYLGGSQLYPLITLSRKKKRQFIIVTCSLYVYIYIIFTRSFPTLRFLEIRDGFEFANKEEPIDRTFLFNLILRNPFSLARYPCLHNSSLPFRRTFFNSGLIGLKGYIPL